MPVVSDLPKQPQQVSGTLFATRLAESIQVTWQRLFVALRGLLNATGYPFVVLKERTLEERFGDRYMQYEGSVNPWSPRSPSRTRP